MKSTQNKELTPEEKGYLVAVITEELNHLRRDGKTILVMDTPRFLAAEERMEEFLTRLKSKLQ